MSDWIKGPHSTEWRWRWKGDVLLIVFRGTTSITDVIQNLGFWVRPYRDMQVKWYAHAGFVRKWKGIEDNVMTLLGREQPQRVELKGHSQGGAIAILAHEGIRYNYPDIEIETHAYGCPRVVWWWNLNKIRDRFRGVLRTEHRGDIVTQLPPKILGYRHVGEVRKIGGLRGLLTPIQTHNSYGE